MLAINTASLGQSAEVFIADLSTDAYAKEVFLHCTVTQQTWLKHRRISIGHKEVLLESECRENREI